MKMVKLEVKKEEKHGKDMACAACESLPTLYLHGDVLTQLGVDVRKLSPGDVMDMQARVVVSSVSEFRTAEEARPTLEISFVKVGLSNAMNKADAEFGEGFDDD